MLKEAAISWTPQDIAASFSIFFFFLNFFYKGKHLSYQGLILSPTSSVQYEDADL